MADLRIYRAPSGLTFQYPEGHAPEGYELVTPEAPDKPKAAPKRRRTTNKAVRPANK